MSMIENKRLARQFLEEVVNLNAVNRLSEFLSPDYYVVLPTGMRGIGAAKEHLETFHHCYPDLHVTVNGQVAEDDIVVTWFTMRGTHQGDWGQIKATHQPITLHGVNIQKFRDGLILEQWGAANTFEALLEIGAIRPNGVDNTRQT